jgi:hypothetical protein
MLYKLSRLFVIKNKFEAFAIIYGIALGAVERGKNYLLLYPGFGGKLLFGACCLAVVMAGAKILDGVRATPRRAKKPRTKGAQAIPQKLQPMDMPSRRKI